MTIPYVAFDAPAVDAMIDEELARAAEAVEAISREEALLRAIFGRDARPPARVAGRGGVMYVSRRCGCGRIYHDRLWWHERNDDPGLCNACLTDAWASRGPLPSWHEVSPEPIVNGDEEPFAASIQNQIQAGAR